MSEELKRGMRKRRQHIGIVKHLTPPMRRDLGGCYRISYVVAHREILREMLDYWHPSWAKRRAKP